MEILRLSPVGKDYLWGGTRLRDEYGKKLISHRLRKRGNAPSIRMVRALYQAASSKERRLLMY